MNTDTDMEYMQKESSIELEEGLGNLLHSYERYYDIHMNGEDGADTAPFAAVAEFHDHTEQYFLVRSAHLSSIDSSEYVYFALEEHLDRDMSVSLSDTAWENGLARVVPNESHRNTDVTLFILADQIDNDAAGYITHIHHYKSYRHTLWGWSNFRAIAVELPTGRMAFNRQGQDLKDLARNIYHESPEESE